MQVSRVVTNTISKNRITMAIWKFRPVVHITQNIWVKLGNFGHQINSDIHLQTVEIQMSRLIRIFTVCLLIYFFIQIIKTRNEQGHCPNLPDVRSYLTLPYWPMHICLCRCFTLKITCLAQGPMSFELTTLSHWSPRALWNVKGKYMKNKRDNLSLFLFFTFRSTPFQSCRDGSSRVEPVQSRG